MNYAIRNTVAALGIVTVLAASAAFAGVFGGSGGGGLSLATANTLYCQLAGCTFTGPVTFPTTTLSVRSSAATQFQVGSAGTQVFNVNGNTATFTGGNALTFSGLTNDVTTGTNEDFQIAPNGTGRTLVAGQGKLAVATQQSVSCAGGVLALDPTSSVVYINANSAACVVTLGEANAITGSDVEIILTANVSGAVTFPNVANVHAGPVLCTTTGLSTIGSSYRIHYAATLNEYVGVACNAN